jgi:hypothetical protein
MCVNWGVGFGYVCGEGVSPAIILTILFLTMRQQQPDPTHPSFIFILTPALIILEHPTSRNMYSHADNAHTACSQSIFSRCSFVFFLHDMFRSTLLDGSMWLTSAAFNSHASLFHFGGRGCPPSDDLKTSEHKSFENWILHRPQVRGWETPTLLVVQ